MAPVEILLVDENPGDIRLTREALSDARFGNHLHVVCDGVEAMAFLRREGAYSDAPRPGLVLLEARLPRKDGREVLAEMKADADLFSIPVVLLTATTEHADDRADCSISKPVDLDMLMHVVQTIASLWVEIVRVPLSPPGGSSRVA